MAKKEKEEIPESSLGEEKNEATRIKWKEQKLQGWFEVSHAKKINQMGELSEMKKSW